jgi:hypothetical protein
VAAGPNGVNGLAGRNRCGGLAAIGSADHTDRTRTILILLLDFVVAAAPVTPATAPTA